MFDQIIHLQYCYEYLVGQIDIKLLLYSHIPTALVALLFGAYIFLRSKTKRLLGGTLFAVCILFAFWSFFDLISWFAFLGSGEMMFAWSVLDFLALLFFCFGYYFLYVFIKNTDIPRWQLLTGIILISPIFVTTLLGLNLTLFDANICEAWENDSIIWYQYVAEGFVLLSCILLAITSYIRTRNHKEREKIVLSSLGIILFLGFFFTAAFSVSLLVNYDIVEYAYNFGIYGLFGMPILLIFLGYLVVKHQVFNIKLIGAQAIIITLVLLDASQAFFSSSRAELMVNIFTILLVILFGSFLVRSVKQEIRSSERNEALAKDLAHANSRLRELDRQKSEFVSIASHQLRSPLTSIRGYASMLLEGSYGKLPPKVIETVQRIQESSGFMALSIEDFLNVSRIEQGRMKYEIAEVNVLDMARNITDEMRPAAIKKGLMLLFRSKVDGKGIAHVDPGKMRQVIYNLIDNSLKYTQKGSVSVFVEDNPSEKKLILSVTDTGVGMSEETRRRLFDKFVRAKNANSINVSGTGLGLYVARQMIEAMQGKISAQSPGEGEGSSFVVELPLIE